MFLNNVGYFLFFQNIQALEFFRPRLVIFCSYKNVLVVQTICFWNKVGYFLLLKQCLSTQQYSFSEQGWLFFVLLNKLSIESHSLK